MKMLHCCPKGSIWIASLTLAVAAFALGHWSGVRRAGANPRSALDWSRAFPAGFSPDSAANTKNMSFATGRIEGDVEGLYVLDHLTGNLQCYVLNARSGQLGASYRTNVLEDMGIQPGTGELEYGMVTGAFDFSNLRQGQDRYAQCICYVTEVNSGRILGYTFMFNGTLASRGELQTGTMVKVVDWAAREQGLIRD